MTEPTLSYGLAGCPATVETYMSIPKFHLSMFDQQLSDPLANQFHRLLLKLEMLFFKN
jgi:hypothetical protein